VWDVHSRQRLAVLRGLSQRVNLVSFSPDDKFVCGCGEVFMHCFIIMLN
jgi:WD40 repeat protein